MIALPRLWQRSSTHDGGPCVLPRGHPYTYIEMSRTLVRSCLLQSLCEFICLRRSFGNLTTRKSSSSGAYMRPSGISFNTY